MKKLENYFKQFEQLLQRLALDGEIDEYDDGEFTLSLCDFTQDESTIKRVIEENPTLERFYSKSRPIQIQEIENTDHEIMVSCEELSMRTLSEYLQNHPDFNYENSVTSSQSEYVTKRFKSIASLLQNRFVEGLQIPFLERDNNPSKRVPIGYLSYNSNQDSFMLAMSDGDIEEMSMYDAMPLVFNYSYQRRIIKHYEKDNDIIGLSEIPVGYREPVRYSNKDKSTEIRDNTDFLR